MKEFFLGKSAAAKIIATLAAIITIVMFFFGWSNIKEIIITVKGWIDEPTTATSTHPPGSITSDTTPDDKNTAQYSSETQPIQKLDLMQEENALMSDNTLRTINSGDELIANDNYCFKEGSSFYVGDDGSCKSITFLLNREYSYISGYFYLPKEHKNLDYTQYFTIIGDGKKLYQSEGLTAGVTPIAFKVDVSNIKTVEFEFSDAGAISNTFLMSSNRCSHYLAEVYAYSK